jgi:hypothetical protein
LDLLLPTTNGNGAMSYAQPFRLQIGDGLTDVGQHGIGAGELLLVAIAPAENGAVLGSDVLGPHGGARRKKALGDGHGMQRAVPDSLVS